jgi:cytochrome bd ubiquinol oxidase subunit II
LWDGLRARAWPLVGISIGAGLGSLGALLRWHFTLAALSAGAAVATVVWGWGIAQYPLLIPPAVTVGGAKGPETVLWAMTGGMAGGTILLVPSLAYLFYLFKGKRPALPRERP